MGEGAGGRKKWGVCVAHLSKYARGDDVAKRSCNAHTKTQEYRRKENGESCGPKKRIEQRERERE